MTPHAGIAARTRRKVMIRLLACAVAMSGVPAPGLLPTSPRVKKLLEPALDSIEGKQATTTYSKQLGGRCVVGLALYKGGRKKSPKVAEALQACRDEIGKAGDLDIYSHGLAVIFLSEVEPRRNRALLDQYVSALLRKQKPHGGWGYATRSSGDTSQTQYVALGFWQAHRAGVRVSPESAKGMIEWLIATQDPDGSWGYQGKVAEGTELVAQSKKTPTMVAAAGASLMIGADLHGLLSKSMLDTVTDLTGGAGGLPPGVKPVMEGAAAEVKPLPARGIDWPRVDSALDAGEKWMANDPMEPEEYACYYLYAIERYHSFRDARSGDINLEPAWYERGVEWLEKNRTDDDGNTLWNEGCGELIDTGFAALFLMRSTQKSLAGIGEGTMIGGRGIPKNLAGARLSGGKVVVDVDAVGVGDFLAMIDDGEADRLDALAADPLSLVVGDLSEADAERLEQSLRTGEPGQRLIAARALGRTDDLDRVPALIYGLTDPDPQVTLAARDALRRIARRPSGFGLPNTFTEDQRYRAHEQWRSWYMTLRPEAIIDLGR